MSADKKSRLPGLWDETVFKSSVGYSIRYFILTITCSTFDIYLKLMEGLLSDSKIRPINRERDGAKGVDTAMQVREGWKIEQCLFRQQPIRSPQTKGAITHTPYVKGIMEETADGTWGDGESAKTF
ncbi:unnamed protein product [Haemonchus placei]|uniref:Uncharacterized protein n=1 Tax=Haemonchus placei TaxID=6290 RepID=A0A0N4XA52_HAEPC|nr:unnamed protein product [Haemonchus placei]